MMKKKRKPKKRIGISLALLPALVLVAFLPLAAAAARKKPLLDTYAVVSGSVFQDNGYALPGAGVILVPEAQSNSSPNGSPNKTQPIQLATDTRGEFIVRVPPGPMHYTVGVRAKGYQNQQKSVSVTDQERVEVTFQLERESK
jgi:hypothetical protein